MVSTVAVRGTITAGNIHHSLVTFEIPACPSKNALPKKLENADAGRKIIVKVAMVFFEEPLIVSCAFLMFVSVSFWMTRFYTKLEEFLICSYIILVAEELFAGDRPCMPALLELPNPVHEVWLSDLKVELKFGIIQVSPPLPYTVARYFEYIVWCAFDETIIIR
jgi:hypothetical protein